MSAVKKISLTAGLAMGFALLVLALTVPASYADVSNQATQVTFTTPVEIPGQVLPAGTYWFTVVDDNTGLKPIMRISNADNTKTIAQVNTVTSDKNGGFGQVVKADGVHFPTGKLVIVATEGRDNEPGALLMWYYPGRTDGHQFRYTSRRQKQLDEETHQTISVTPGDKITIGRSPAKFE